MKLGVLLTNGVDSLRQAKEAEALGFDSAFYVDSPVLFGDPYVAMAAAAQTRRITLGVGVTNPLTRSAPVTAACAASLNAIAPSRIVLGVGVGFTATLAMGQRQSKLAEMERFIGEVRKLLAGDVAEVNLLGQDTL